jgi:hypothetical protein
LYGLASTSVEFSPEFEVLAVGLLESSTESIGLAAVTGTQIVELSGEDRDEGALGIRARCRGHRSRATVGAEVFDAFAQFGMGVEKRV